MQRPPSIRVPPLVTKHPEHELDLAEHQETYDGARRILGRMRGLADAAETLFVGLAHRLAQAERRRVGLALVQAELSVAFHIPVEEALADLAGSSVERAQRREPSGGAFPFRARPRQRLAQELLRGHRILPRQATAELLRRAPVERTRSEVEIEG